MTPGLATASPRLPILAVALLTAAAANSQTPPPPSPIASGGATFLYLAEQPLTFNSPASILQFHADASGTVSPSNTLKLPPAAGRLAFTVDPSGQTYAAIPAYYEQSGTSQKLARSAEIVIYEPHASEAATPQRTITSGLLNYPQGIAVARSEELYVSDASGTIFVFSSAADGHSDPIRTIYGPATHLSAKTPPGSLAFDADGDLYVAAGTSILVFSPDADKNVAPIRTTPQNTMLATSRLLNWALMPTKISTPLHFRRPPPPQTLAQGFPQSSCSPEEPTEIRPPSRQSPRRPTAGAPGYIRSPSV